MSDFKRRLSFLNLDLRFLQLDHVSVARSLADVLQKVLQHIFLALDFAFNLSRRLEI
jgi:hypothetical protein